MPDIDPAALSRADPVPQLSSAAFGSSKMNGATVTLSLKTAKPVTSAQRIELEPIYTSLKAAIGDQWGEYKETMNLFVLGMSIWKPPTTLGRQEAKEYRLLIGQLNQNELSLRIDHYVISEPAVENLHNQLIAAIYGNITRDLPDQGVAPWVSANEKPMILSKPVSGDAAEQRLKTEVMQLPARERRRLKEIPDVRDMICASLVLG
jgi:transcriptional coactivator HFI1/ADA1